MYYKVVYDCILFYIILYLVFNARGMSNLKKKKRTSGCIESPIKTLPSHILYCRI